MGWALRPWGPAIPFVPFPAYRGGVGRFLFPSWAQGSAQDGWADLELVLKHLRGLRVPACPDIPLLPAPPQQPESAPGLRATCPKGLCPTQEGAPCRPADSSSHSHAREPQGPPSRPRGSLRQGQSSPGLEGPLGAPLPCQTPLRLRV